MVTYFFMEKPKPTAPKSNLSTCSCCSCPCSCPTTVMSVVPAAALFFSFSFCLVLLSLIWFEMFTIGHAPNVWASHDIARYPFKGRNVANVGKGSSAVQSAPSGQATHSHALLWWSVLFKYSPTLQAPHGGNSHPVPSLLGIFSVESQVLRHFC